MSSDWMAVLNTQEIRVLLAALVAILILSLVSRSLTRVMTRLTPSGGFLHELTSRSSSPIHLLLPLVALQMVWNSAANDMVLIAGLRHVTSVAIIASFSRLGLCAVTAVEQFIVARNPVDIADNLRARRIQTQTRVLTRTLSVLVLILGAAGILMTFPSVRQFGASLLASAGLAGLVAGFAAKPVLGNLIAGLQIAITQPIRLDDVVIIEDEWGRIEEITGTYVVVRLWDSRRLVVPLQWIIENPFQNWTRQTSSIIGSVFFWLDYSVPLSALRLEAEKLCNEVRQLWDGEVFVVQVTDCNERAMQVRVLASSADSSRNWDLRCYLREHLLTFLNSHYPESLPKIRGSLESGSVAAPAESRPASGRGEVEHQPPV